MTHPDGFPRLSVRSGRRRDAGHRKRSRRDPKVLGNRRSGRENSLSEGVENP